MALPYQMDYDNAAWLGPTPIDLQWFRHRLFVVMGFLWCLSTQAAAPVLYEQMAYQSPVSGAPDDLLLLAGHGFAANDRVIYQARGSMQDSPRPPPAVPRDSGSELGVAEVVSANVPYSLTIRLPQVLRAGIEYTLWVSNERGEWSRPVRINDARPYWFTPAFVYESDKTGSLPRYLKVVGRNLDPAPGAKTRVRLVGPRTLTLDAERAPDSSLDRFVARVMLPEKLATGRYRVELTRDGLEWIGLDDQTLEVRVDRKSVAQYAITAAEFGSCRADDGQDDLACIQRAIAAAASSGGGTVYFGPGEWDLTRSGSLSGDGIVVPRGVGLSGAGASSSTVVRGPQWAGSSTRATFTLTGANEIRGLRFRDARIYRPQDTAQPFLKLGVTSSAAHVESVESVVIAENTFDRVHRGISDSGAQIRRLFITFNEFGAYADGVFLGGDRLRVGERFRIDDSVIAHNAFKPGSFIDIAGRQGTIASQIGAGYRVDFSNNIADGAATNYLYAAGDARGWRAAYFWHMNDTHEMLLVSQNIATCTGDKVGDGEAIAYDNNGNTFAFERPRQVVEASADSVTVSGPLVSVQNGREIPLDTYYIGHWVQVGDGPGVGQARRIVAYRIDPSAGRVTFSISPRWDVLPVKSVSRIAIGREFWQTYTLSNTIDNRRPACLKSNRSNPSAGVIGLWAQTADSVVAGNRQFDSDGVFLRHSYGSAGTPCASCGLETNFLDFVEVRDNTIDGEYDWNDDCSSSGIFVSLAAAPDRGTPPTVGYGLSIAHNSIRRADGFGGGAIAFTPTWFQGPPPHRWRLVDNALVHHNIVTDVPGDLPRPCKRTGAKQRIGINLRASALAWRTVLYANACQDVSRSLGTGTQQTIIMCPQEDSRSCECAHVRPKPPQLR